MRDYDNALEHINDFCDLPAADASMLPKLISNLRTPPPASFNSGCNVSYSHSRFVTRLRPMKSLNTVLLIKVTQNSIPRGRSRTWSAPILRCRGTFHANRSSIPSKLEIPCSCEDARLTVIRPIRLNNHNTSRIFSTVWFSSVSPVSTNCKCSISNRLCGV